MEKFYTALWKRIFLLMKMPTEGPFRYAGTQILTVVYKYNKI